MIRRKKQGFRSYGDENLVVWANYDIIPNLNWVGNYTRLSGVM